jgi:hypothetical protein
VDKRLQRVSRAGGKLDVTASSRTKAVGIGGGVDGRGPSFEAAQSHSAVKKVGDDHAQVGNYQTERRPRNPATAAAPDIITTKASSKSGAACRPFFAVFPRMGEGALVE